MNTEDRIYVAGHTGMLGSAIVRKLDESGYKNIITCPHSELDLTRQTQVSSFFETHRPEYVFFAAAKVGGIHANETRGAEFLYENLMMQCHVIHQAFLFDVRKLIFIASGDVYPSDCPQPSREEYILSGRPEPTCEPFAVAKIAGIKMCENYNRQYGTRFRVMIPSSVYGPRQHYDVVKSQVIPTLIKKMHDAKKSALPEISLWGSGSPVRDFIYTDDVADAAIHLIQQEEIQPGPFNVGTGRECSIRELAGIIRGITGYEGRINFDTSRSDGAMKKTLHLSKLEGTGWKSKTSLEEGIRKSYFAYQSELKQREVRESRINRVHAGKKDIQVHDEICASSEMKRKEQPETYKRKVVQKPWGYEFLVFENECVAGWLLYIRHGEETSMHCHPYKKTSLILLAGEATSQTLDRKRFLRAGDALILEKKVFHSTRALSEEGVYILEVETPPNKTDLVRLHDNYGREKSGYEGVSEMVSDNLEKYHYFYFEEDNTCKKETCRNPFFKAFFEIYPNQETFRKHFKPAFGDLITVFKCRILDRGNNPLLDTGDTQRADLFMNIREQLKIDDRLVIFRLENAEA